jgi:hypothetical protein
VTASIGSRSGGSGIRSSAPVVARKRESLRSGVVDGGNSCCYPMPTATMEAGKTHLRGEGGAACRLYNNVSKAAQSVRACICLPGRRAYFGSSDVKHHAGHLLAADEQSSSFVIAPRGHSAPLKPNARPLRKVVLC